MDISNVFVSKRYLGINLLILDTNLKKNKFYRNLKTVDYPEVIPLFP